MAFSNTDGSQTSGTVANPSINNENYYKNPNGGFVNVAFADPSLKGTKIYSAAEAGISAPKITSSSQPILDQKKQQAVNDAGNALTNSSGKTAPNPTYGGIDSNTLNMILSSGKSGQETAKAIADRLLNAQQLSYNTALASQNAKYASLASSLQTEYQRHMESAKATAASLNPYATAKGALTANEFTARITDDYNTAAQSLQQQADMAQKELAAGNYKAYVDIQNGLDTTMENLNRQTQSMLMDFAKQAEQTRQFNATYDLNSRNVAFDNALNSFKTANYSPEDINKLIDNGQIYGDPSFQNFFKATGSDPNSIPGILNMMKSGSIAAANLALSQQRQQSMEALGWARLAQATEKVSANQMASNAIQQVGNTQRLLEAQGVKYGTPEYAAALANASAGGVRPSQADKDRYAALDQLANSLGRLKEDVNNLGTNSQIWNIANTAAKNPYADSVTKFVAQMQGISTQISKGIYGEGGRLSDDDIRRVLASVGNSYQSTNVREGLYNELLKKVQDAAVSKLASDSAAGYDVSGYIPTVNKVVSEAQNAAITNSGAYKPSFDVDAYIKGLKTK